MGIILRSEVMVEAKDFDISRQEISHAVLEDISLWNRNKGIVEVSGAMFLYQKIRRIMESGKAISLLVVTVK